MTSVNLYKFIRSEHVKSTIESGMIKLTQLSTSNDPLEFLPCGNSTKLKKWAKRTEDKEPLVLCLSPQISSAPMWSHYAENHQGAAIVFQFNISQSYCVSINVGNEKNIKLYIHKTDENYFLVKCIYLDKRMEIVIDDDDWNELEVRSLYNTRKMESELWFSILKMVASKGKVWEYEQEYRLLFYDDEQVKLAKNKRFVIDLFRDKITGIILGLNKNEKISRAKVKHWCLNKNIFVDTTYRSEQTFEIQNNSTSDSINLLNKLERNALNLSWMELLNIMQ